MSKVKSFIIYVLSVALAFESGLFVTFVSAMVALHREKEANERYERYKSRMRY